MANKKKTKASPAPEQTQSKEKKALSLNDVLFFDGGDSPDEDYEEKGEGVEERDHDISFDAEEGEEGIDGLDELEEEGDLETVPMFGEDDDLELGEEDEEGDEEEEEEGEEEASKYLSLVPRAFINDEAGLLDKLDEIYLRPPREEDRLIETFEFTMPEHPDVTNIHDDLDRETKFYQTALATWHVAKEQLKTLKVPTKRPGDYFAEMLKSDKHMQRIKLKLVQEKERIEAFEKRKKNVLMKQFNKQAQAEKKAQQARTRKQNIEAVSKWRKDREKGNATSSTPVDLIDADDGKKGSKRKFETKPQFEKKQKLSKKDGKAKKYGAVLDKKTKRKNTSESSSDLSSFNRANNNADRTAHFKKVKAGAKKRPGKSQRKRQ